MILNSAKRAVLAGEINPLTDDIRIALLTNAHSTDIDAQEFWSDISANEASGTGYTAGGELLTGKSVVADDTDDEGAFDADDVTWAASTITARFVAIYKDTGTPATSPVLSIIDFGSDQSSSASNFTIQWNSEGIFNLN